MIYVRKNHTPSVRTCLSHFYFSWLLSGVFPNFSICHAQVGVVVEVLPSGNLRIQCGGSLLEPQKDPGLLEDPKWAVIKTPGLF